MRVIGFTNMTATCNSSVMLGGGGVSEMFISSGKYLEVRFNLWVKGGGDGV